MKKKFFSKLLMGALLVATVSSYVSCKDYDDDIANLQTQIDLKADQADLEALQAKLDEAKAQAAADLAAAEANLKDLISKKADQSALDAAKDELEKAIAEVKAAAEKAGADAATALNNAAAAQSAADKAQGTADAAQGAADKAQGAADAAQGAADKAQGAADKAQSTADAAQAAADAAAKAAADASKKVDDAITAATTQFATALEGKADKATTDAAIADLKKNLTDLGEAQKDYAIAKDVKAATDQLKANIDALQAQLNNTAAGEATIVTYAEYNKETQKWEEKTGKLSDAMSTLTTSIKAYAAGVDAIWGSAVTSVSLYTTYAGGDHGLQAITFLNIDEVKTTKFPEDAKKAATGGEQLKHEFVKGMKAVINLDEIVIRVSPVNAKVDVSKIKLINSQGKAIPEELIKVVSAEPYKELLTANIPATRADVEVKNNGLWTLKFEVNDVYDPELFDEYTKSGKDKVLFAVAVNTNDDSDDLKERYVISEFDLYLTEGDILHAWDFTVGTKDKSTEKSVAAIHNRYETCEDGTKTWFGVENANNVNELTWNLTKKQLESGIWSYLDEDGKVKVDSVDRYQYTGIGKGDGIDNRQEMPILNVKAGDEIWIRFPYEDQYGKKPIRGFYVVLDRHFAEESKPSEINAWTSYEYENVGVQDPEHEGQFTQTAHLFDGELEGYIKVKDLHNVKHDIIGFRVFAVNYDGTLVDPDGRAFYVYVGDEVKEVEATADVPVTDVDLTANADANFSEIITLPDGLPTDANIWTAAVWGENNPYVSGYTPAVWAPVAGTSNKVQEVSADGSLGTAVYTGFYGITDLFDIWYTDDLEGTWVLANKEVRDITPKYVKVQLKYPNRLLDDETYTVVITGKKVITGLTNGKTTVEDLANLTIKIKKVLPASIPANFAFKAGQSKPVNIYVKPVGKGGTTTGAKADWDVTRTTDKTDTYVKYAYDILPYDFTQIFNGLKDGSTLNENYSFEFLKTDINADEDVVSTTAFVEKDNSGNKNGKQLLAGETDVTKATNGLIANSYSAPWVAAAQMSGTKDVTVKYNYGELSLTINENGKGVKNDWIRKDETKVTVTYNSAFDMNRIESPKDAQSFNYKEKTYTVNLTKVTFKDLEDGKGHLETLGLKEATYASRTGLPAKSDKATLASLITDKYVQIDEESIELSGDDFKDYFVLDKAGSNVTAGNGTIKLIATNQLDNEQSTLTKDMEATLTFTVKNIFGDSQKVTIKLKMTKPELAARGL